MQFRAKVDWWIGLSLAAGILIPVVAAISAHTPWVCLASMASLVLVFGFGFPQWYETTGQALIIRAGFVTKAIPYNQITAVRPSSDSRSALALSLDRVQVEYGSCDLLIAPENKELFFAELARHAPQLSKRGQDLVISFSS